MSTTNLESEIRRLALELGAAAVGIARLDDESTRADAARLRRWLASGFGGTMRWLARDPERRADPRRSLAHARSLVAVAFDYARPQLEPGLDAARRAARAGRVARYARGRDYHRVIPPRMRQLLALVQRHRPEALGRLYVDTGPVLERAWAQRAGIGWIGKHSLALRQDGGSWFVLGALLLDCELEPDAPAADHCGSCRRCLDRCPTGAIVAPYHVDSRRCISYLTIELREAIPPALRPLVGDRIFGCDDCQEACPWNEHAAEARLADYEARDGVLTTPLRTWLDLDEASFRERFLGTPILRARRDGFLRNVCVAIGNTGDGSDVPRLARTLTEDPSALVRAHAAWALGRIGGEEACTARARAAASDPDESVRAEAGTVEERTR